MAKSGGQAGNKNASHDKPWSNALRRALLEGNGKKLRAVADQLVAKAESGDVQAIKEIGDRLDGRPAQTIQGPASDGSLKIIHSVE